MFARRYMHEFGATSEDLGRVTVADRKHAATNPDAFFYQRPITLEQPRITEAKSELVPREGPKRLEKPRLTPEPAPR